MSSVLRAVRKRKKVPRLGAVDIIRREDYADLELDAKVELIRSLVPLDLLHVQELLDEEVPVKLHVDLGNRGALSLIPGSASGLEIPPDTTAHQGFGLSGRTHSRLGRIDRLTLGRFALSGVDTTFSTSGYATAGGRHGVLGLGILQRFTVIFDYSRDVM